MMASFVDREEFVRAHEILAESAIERLNDRALAVLGVHIGSTLSHVYPDAPERAS